jgi:hypothetical protein
MAFSRKEISQHEVAEYANDANKPGEIGEIRLCAAHLHCTERTIC